MQTGEVRAAKAITEYKDFRTKFEKFIKFFYSVAYFIAC